MSGKLLDALAPGDTISAEYAATFERKEYLEPEKTLVLAILQDALHHFQQDRNATDRLSRERFLEAEAWIMTPGNDWIFTFDNACELLNIDPGYLRERLKKLAAEPARTRRKEPAPHQTP
jgi:hypothetical protein